MAMICGDLQSGWVDMNPPINDVTKGACKKLACNRHGALKQYTNTPLDSASLEAGSHLS